MDEQTKIKVTAGGAIGFGAIASFIGMCCIGPWAVSLFGVSGAITLARYDFLRPYIMGIAAIMLGWGFWHVYRPQPVCAEDRCTTGPTNWLKVSLWIATIMLFIAFFAEPIQWLFVNSAPEGVR